MIPTKLCIPKEDYLIQKYLQGKTTHQEERELLDNFLKFYNNLVKDIGLIKRYIEFEKKQKR